MGFFQHSIGIIIVAMMVFSGAESVATPADDQMLQDEQASHSIVGQNASNGALNESASNVEETNGDSNDEGDGLLADVSDTGDEPDSMPEEDLTVNETLPHTGSALDGEPTGITSDEDAVSRSPSTKSENVVSSAFDEAMLIQQPLSGLPSTDQPLSEAKATLSSVEISDLRYSCEDKTLSFQYELEGPSSRIYIQNRSEIVKGIVDEFTVEASGHYEKTIDITGWWDIGWKDIAVYAYTADGGTYIGPELAPSVPITDCTSVDPSPSEPPTDRDVLEITITNFAYACDTEVLSFGYEANRDFTLTVTGHYSDAAQSTFVKAPFTLHEPVSSSGHFNTTAVQGENSLLFRATVHVTEIGSTDDSDAVASLDIDCTSSEPGSPEAGTAQMTLTFMLCANEECATPHDTSHDGSTVTWTIRPEMAMVMSPFTHALQASADITLSGVLKDGIAAATSPALPLGSYSVCIDPLLTGPNGETRIAISALCSVIDLTEANETTPATISQFAFVQAPERPETPEPPAEPEAPADPTAPPATGDVDNSEGTEEVGSGTGTTGAVSGATGLPSTGIGFRIGTAHSLTATLAFTSLTVIAASGAILTELSIRRRS